MPLETVTNGIQDLNPSWPSGTDPKSQGDDHMRNTKKAVQLTFPNSTAPWQTTNKITGGGYDASGVKIEHVGVGVEATDAARKGDVDAIQDIVDAQNAEIAALSAEVTALDIEVTNLQGQVDAQPKMAWGVVGSNGASGNTPGSLDWSSSRLALGYYRIVFDVAASGDDFNQAVTTTAYGTGVQAVAIIVQPVSNNVVDIFTRETEGSAASAVDTTFGFTRTVT